MPRSMIVFPLSPGFVDLICAKEICQIEARVQTWRIRRDVGDSLILASRRPRESSATASECDMGVDILVFTFLTPTQKLLSSCNVCLLVYYGKLS
ncbi:hypothetical protein GGR58DRAFT_26146 [Xylaria digitata]|nr:hypothetical protein GGR58DRAFT_26146 [Xylaria digitata]